MYRNYWRILKNKKADVPWGVVVGLLIVMLLILFLIWFSVKSGKASVELLAPLG